MVEEIHEGAYFASPPSNPPGKIWLRLLLFVLATEHTLLRMFLSIWRQILIPGDLHDASLENFCTIKCGTFNCPRCLQLP